MGEQRARPRCLPLANLSFGGANREREGEGRQVRREGGAGMGRGDCKTNGVDSHKFPRVVRVEGAGQHPSLLGTRPWSCLAGSDWFTHLSLPPAPWPDS